MRVMRVICLREGDEGDEGCLSVGGRDLYVR
jgi:hypothetical protein